ncbi:MAG: Stp1/IreP family PP2C-type Ser/Thr phosphatase [Bradymonadia bacterium]
MEVRFWAATDVGRTRDHNEDNFLVDKKLNLFIVADGMGGHAAGEIASSVAVREVRRVVAEHRDVIDQYQKSQSADDRAALLSLLEKSIKQACARIHELAEENPDRRGMGTTTSLMLVSGRRGFIAHVGDSRIYMLRNNQVHQLTEDHSLVNELIKRGRLKPGDVFDSPYKNAVTRAVGVYPDVEVDTLDFDVLPGDDFLICSDGLSCYIDDDITRDILKGQEIKELPERFIRLANECGGKDNITAIVIRMAPDEADRRDDATEEVRHKLDTLRSIPLFKYLGYKSLVKVMNITETRAFPQNTLIFEEGTRGDTFFIVLQGRIRIEKGGVQLAELGEGGHFGEMAMVDKSPRSASARTLSDTHCLVIQRQQFYELMRKDAVMAVKLLWSFIQVLNTRLRMTNSELLSARETIDVLKQKGTGQASQVAMPEMDPAIAAVAALPVGVTDELIPGFLFAENARNTDPLMRIDEHAAAGHVDMDARPGLEDLTPAPSDGAASSSGASSSMSSVDELPEDGSTVMEDPDEDRRDALMAEETLDGTDTSSIDEEIEAEDIEEIIEDDDEGLPSLAPPPSDGEGAATLVAEPSVSADTNPLPTLSSPSEGREGPSTVKLSRTGRRSPGEGD